MSSITPDLVEWMISDEKVSGRWRSFARRLGFAKHIPELEIGSRRSNKYGSRNRADRHRMQALFKLWEAHQPEKYTLAGLKNLLVAEGLHDMWVWVNMMTQSSPVSAQVSDVVYRNIPPSPIHTPVKNVNSPYSSYFGAGLSPGPLASPLRNIQGNQQNQNVPTSYSYRGSSTPNRGNEGSTPYRGSEGSTPYSVGGRSNGGIHSPRWTPAGPVPTSPYSALFQRCESPSGQSTSSLYMSSRDSSTHNSRPSSQMSDYYLGDYLWSPGSQLQREGVSCPNTPLSSRRSYSPSMTSPGWIRSNPSTPHSPWTKSSNIVRSKSSLDKKNVFNLLYRPDLIKLSSPINKYSRPVRSERSDYDVTTEDERSEPSPKSPKLYVTEKTFFVESPPPRRSGGGGDTKAPKDVTTTAANRDAPPVKNGPKVASSEKGKTKEEFLSEKTVTARNVFAELDEIVDLCKTANSTDRSQPVNLSRETLQIAVNHSHAPLAKSSQNGGMDGSSQNGGMHKPIQNGGLHKASQDVELAKPFHNGGSAKPSQNGMLVKPNKDGGSAMPSQDGGTSFKINIERKKRIEIGKFEAGNQQDFDFDFSSIQPGKDNTYTEYFDNLIALIDEATRELSI